MDEQTRNEVFEYLDGLRETGVTNMFGATPYLVEQFGFDRTEAQRWLVEWMHTFGERHPRRSRTEDGEK
jgi:hypothetical protein